MERQPAVARGLQWKDVLHRGLWRDKPSAVARGLQWKDVLHRGLWRDKPLVERLPEDQKYGFIC